jgi:hypothetical protein
MCLTRKAFSKFIFPYFDSDLHIDEDTGTLEPNYAIMR